MICRSCQSSRIIDVLQLGNQYLSDFIDKNDPKPLQYPLNLVLCKDCSLVQLRETTPAQVLYTDHYGYRSGINQTMRDQLKEIVDRACERVNLEKGDIVVSIGENDGTLISNFPDDVIKVAYEPVKKFANDLEDKADYVISDYFSAKNYPKIKKAKIITAISMFYDLDDPNSFVQDLVSILDEKGIIVIQQNYLLKMLQQNAFDNIVHEHLEYYSLTSLEKLLNRHGLEVFDVETNDINGGSFRTYIRHMDSVKKMRYLEKQYKLDQWGTYLLFALQIKGIKNKLYNFVKQEVDKGKVVYVFGASTRGNTLLQYCGLDNKLIKKAIERNPEKWGKNIASVDIPIISEEQAEKEKFDYALFLPWFFRDELISRYKHLSDKGVKFIFPLPKMEII